MQKCFECGEEAEHQHHVVPRSLGGKQTLPLCARCHSLVHDSEVVTTSALSKKVRAEKRATEPSYYDGGIPPYGYEIVFSEGDRTLSPCAKTHFWFLYMLRRRKEGTSLRQIAKELNSFPESKSGYRVKPWRHANVYQILKRVESTRPDLIAEIKQELI